MENTEGGSGYLLLFLLVLLQLLKSITLEWLLSVHSSRPLSKEAL